MDETFFCNSSAESNEAAIKCSRRHASNRGITDPVIITFHGRTLAALSATGQPKYNGGFSYGGEMVPRFQYVTFNDPDELVIMVEEMNQTPEEDAKAGRKRGVAAIMLEALQGEGGIITGDPEYFALARKLSDDCGALFMCDEVQLDMGQSGTLWDLKILASSQMCSSPPRPLVEVCLLVPWLQGRRGEQLSEGLGKLAEKYPQVLTDTRGWGLLKGIKINDDVGVTAGELMGSAMEEGLLLVAAGRSVVRFIPPLIVTKGGNLCSS